MGWDELRREQADRRERGDPVRLGLGISTYHRVVRAGAPSRVLGALRYGAGRLGARARSECCRPARSRSSPARARTVRGTRRRGARSSPTGSACRSRTSRSCTATRQSSPRGWTPTARGRLAVGAIAVSNAALQVIDKAKPDRRAHARGQRATTSSSPTARSACKGAPRHRQDHPRRRLRARSPAHDMPDGVEPNLDADATFDPVALSFPHGTHLCAIEVDTETGRATIRRYVCVDDVGEVINPLIVDGQVHGGLAQGIAQALYEEAVYDADGNADDRLVRRLPRTVGGRTCRRSITDRTVSPSTTNPLRREGRRRGRHDRRDAGRRQRDRRRGAPIRRHGHSDAVHAGTDLARGQASVRRERRSGRDPGAVRLRAPRPRVDEASAGPRERRRGRHRCSPAGSR